MVLSDYNSEAYSLTQSSKNYEKKDGSRRDLIAFWIFGATTDLAYFVMITSAYDILRDEPSKSNLQGNFSANLTKENFTVKPDTVYLQCNPISTGAVLLADSLPALIVKFTLPVFLLKIPYSVKVSIIAGSEICSLLIVAFSYEVWLSLIGVSLASFASGVGESSFLSLTTLYHSKVVSMWSSGMAAAGMIGSLATIGLIQAGVSPRTSLIIVAPLPIAMMLTYLFILTKPEPETNKTEPDKPNGVTLYSEKTNEKKIELSLREKIYIIPQLLKYILQLTLVYIGSYLINQGLTELLYFNDIFFSPAEQYRWYQFDYQFGAFIAMFTIKWFTVDNFWALPILQFVNVTILLLQIFFRFIPSFYIVLAIVFWEAIILGVTYINVFQNMTRDIQEEYKEYAIGIASTATSIGIFLGGFTALPTHNAICEMNIKL